MKELKFKCVLEEYYVYKVCYALGKSIDNLTEDKVQEYLEEFITRFGD